MKPKRLLIILAVFALISPMSVLAVSSPPSIPLLVYGNVAIDGQPASVGTEILAEIDNIEIATTATVKEGKYFIEIPDGKDNEGKTITFKVNGIIDNDSQAQCVDVATIPSINLDLSVATPSPTPVNSGGSGGSTGGGSTGGGGGGGGTPVQTTSPSNQNLSVAAQAVDTNNDNKIDILDFNTLMVNWGSTGTGNVADFNGDGKVDIFDFNLLMIHWMG